MGCNTIWWEVATLLQRINNNNNNISIVLLPQTMLCRWLKMAHLTINFCLTFFNSRLELLHSPPVAATSSIKLSLPTLHLLNSS